MGGDRGPGGSRWHLRGLPCADFPGGQVDDADGSALGFPARAGCLGSHEVTVGGVERDAGTVWRGGDSTDYPRDGRTYHGKASGPALTVDGEPEEPCLMRGDGDAAGSRLDRASAGAERRREEGAVAGGRRDPSGQLSSE